MKTIKHIEIRRVGFINKGAELMFLSILNKIKDRFPESKYVMAPSSSAPYMDRCKNGLYQKSHLWYRGMQLGALAKVLPSKLREFYGIILNNQIDLVLDAAGFGYGDFLGKKSCLELSNSSKKWRKNNTKFILLPQAFGTFKTPTNKKAIKTIVQNATLIFARDKRSYNNLVEVVGAQDKIQVCGDFTNLLEGVIPQNFDAINNRFCIVPNYRMIDRTTKKESQAYLPLMIEVTRYLHENNQKPFFLIHEGEEDFHLAKEIIASVDENIQIIKESDPLKIKGILGSSSGSVGSRFHGLVSALSQGVPCLGTGWSHKYQMLFEEYEFEEGLMDVHISKEELHQKLRAITEEKNIAELRSSLLNVSIELKTKSELMWQKVFAAIEK